MVVEECGSGYGAYGDGLMVGHGGGGAGGGPGKGHRRGFGCCDVLIRELRATSLAPARWEVPGVCTDLQLMGALAPYDRFPAKEWEPREAAGVGVEPVAHLAIHVTSRRGHGVTNREAGAGALEPAGEAVAQRMQERSVLLYWRWAG